jgi:hypothetical protein
MSIKLKALGLGLLATMALAGFMAMNATAETGGHFTSEATHTIISGEDETGVNRPELRVPGLTGIVCDKSTYSGTTNATTVESITITPTYEKCHTTGDEPEIKKPVTVDVNGCTYTFTIGKKSTADNTVDLVCPGEKKYIAVTHEGCEIRILAANGIKGVAYKTTTINSKHAITLEATAAGFVANFEAGFCILLGTSHTGELIGSVNVTGKDTLNNAVGITATGSEG